MAGYENAIKVHCVGRLLMRNVKVKKNIEWMAASGRLTQRTFNFQGPARQQLAHGKFHLRRLQKTDVVGVN